MEHGPDYCRVFDLSFERAVGEHPVIFFDNFYQRFLASSPEVASKFADTDMPRQREMLRSSLIHMLNFFVTHRGTDYMRSLAVTHDKDHRDIAPHLYELWLTALIDTARELDSLFDDQVELAWKVVMAPGIAFMVHHYGG